MIVARRDAAELAPLAARLGDRVQARAIDLARPETLVGGCPPARWSSIRRRRSHRWEPPRTPWSAPPLPRARSASSTCRRPASMPPAPARWSTSRGRWRRSLAPASIASPPSARAAGVAAALDVPAVILRPAGIYGPGRGVLARLRAGTLRIVGERDTAVSRIHVADLASAIIRAGTARTVPSPAYNVADREAAPTRVRSPSRRRRARRRGARADRRVDGDSSRSPAC